MNLNDLTPAQRAELKAQLEAAERAEKQKRQDDIDAYKQSVDDFVRGTFERMQRVSALMRSEKDSVFTAAETLITLKDELYNTSVKRYTAISPFRICVNYHTHAVPEGQAMDDGF